MNMRVVLIALLAISFCVVNATLITKNITAQFITADEQVKSLTNQINFSSISLPNSDKNTTIENSQSIPDLLVLDNASAMVIHSLASYWTDPFKECVNPYKCAINYTSGWKDNTSLQISTTNNSEHNWSYIVGKPIDVNPDEQYVFTTHVELNKYAAGTHILMEGYNQTWGQWYQLGQCPGGINGPLNWSAFSCGLTIPEKITKIRPVMNAGWSSQRDQEAVSMFDAFSLEKTDNGTLKGPVVSDPNLRIKIVAEGLQSPTAMAFLGPNDFLVAEQNLGAIKRIVNDTILPQPLLRVNVGNEPDWGLLGLAVQKNRTDNKLTYVFVYYTETERAGADHGKALGNRLYRYQLSEDGSKLINPTLLLDLPTAGGAVSYHNGGAILIGPDSNLYVPIGDVNIHRSEAQNYKDSAADGTGGILRITQDGKPVGKGILGNTYPLNLYYAYGIRNSYGIDFDPISGKLWDTENGPEFGDEINLVEPGFNSGWAVVQGTTVMASHGSTQSVNVTFPTSLVNFEGKGTYSGPELTWNLTVGPTALKFLKSEALGKQYANDMFVGSTSGDIFHFNLNKNRDALSLRGLLADKVANDVDETQGLVWGRNFNVITNIEVGPDGYLYVVSNTNGKIYKISAED
jgi:aldose sugar dehydrogenase